MNQVRLRMSSGSSADELLSAIVGDLELTRGGNTSYKLPREKAIKSGEKAPRQVQYKQWIAVLNNWTDEEYRNLHEWCTKHCEKFIIGKEMGAGGTNHLQIAFILYKKARMDEIKRACQCTRLHLEKMGGTWEDQKYCMKEGDYIGRCLPYNGEDLPKYEQLWEWQRKLVDIMVKAPRNDRKIYWFYNLDGNAGKSVIAKWLAFHYNAIKISGGKRNDVINTVYNCDNKEMIVLDIPRSAMSISYNAIEEIKNGHITNDKYETGTALFFSPKVVIFSNMFPEVSKLSLDRWYIYNINNDDPHFIMTMYQNKLLHGPCDRHGDIMDYHLDSDW